MKQVILKRLQKCTEHQGDLSEKQKKVFRKKKINHRRNKFSVIEGAETSNSKFCAVITLDVKNAFNRAKWDCIPEFHSRIKIHNCLCRTLKNYY